MRFLRTIVSMGFLGALFLMVTQIYAAGVADWPTKRTTSDFRNVAENMVAANQLAAKTITPNSSKLCAAVILKKRERYHLPPPKSRAPGISFATDWDQNPTGGWYGQQAVDGCRIHPDGFLTWHNKVAVRVEVQPADDPLRLNSNSERAEMLVMQDTNGTPITENKTSGIQYYATSYYFPTNWRGEQLPWSAFAPTDCSSGDQNQCNSWSFVLQFYRWGALIAGTPNVGGPARYIFNRSLFNDGGRLALGKWTDLVFKINWGTGEYTIWRRDEGNKTFTKVLVGRSPPPSKIVYFKQGLYRGGNVRGRTDVLWIGPTSRGSSFAAVEKQSFGTESMH